MRRYSACAVHPRTAMTDRRSRAHARKTRRDASARARRPCATPPASRSSGRVAPSALASGRRPVSGLGLADRSAFPPRGATVACGAVLDGLTVAGAAAEFARARCRPTRHRVPVSPAARNLAADTCCAMDPYALPADNAHALGIQRGPRKRHADVAVAPLRHLTLPQRRRPPRSARWRRTLASDRDPARRTSRSRHQAERKVTANRRAKPMATQMLVRAGGRRPRGQRRRRAARVVEDRARLGGDDEEDAAGAKVDTIPGVGKDAIYTAARAADAAPSRRTSTAPRVQLRVAVGRRSGNRGTGERRASVVGARRCRSPARRVQAGSGPPRPPRAIIAPFSTTAPPRIHQPPRGRAPWPRSSTSARSAAR